MYSINTSKTLTFVLVQLTLTCCWKLSPTNIVLCQQYHRPQHHNNIRQIRRLPPAELATNQYPNNNTSTTTNNNTTLHFIGSTDSSRYGHSLLRDPADQQVTTQPPPPPPIPEFEAAIENQTIAVGRDAQLSCKIKDLGNFRTAWLRVEDKGILTIHNNIITRNYRIGLMNNDNGKEFVLTIRNVQPSDKVSRRGTDAQHPRHRP